MLETTYWTANSNVVVASYRKCPWEFPSEAKTPWREGKFYKVINQIASCSSQSAYNSKEAPQLL
jgi:hypothetical protein